MSAGETGLGGWPARPGLKFLVGCPCQCLFSLLLNAFTEGVLTTFSGRLFQVSTTRLLNEFALTFSLDLFFCSLNECPLVARYILL